MSKINRNVELTPPDCQSTTEKLVSVGHCCEYCHGNGWFWGEDEHGEDIHVDCPVCQGHKEVDAVIDIKWQPSIHNNK